MRLDVAISLTIAGCDSDTNVAGADLAASSLPQFPPGVDHPHPVRLAAVLAVCGSDKDVMGLRTDVHMLKGV